MQSKAAYKEVAERNQRLRVGFDLDGVLADWARHFFATAARYDRRVPILTYSEMKSWDLCEATDGVLTPALVKRVLLGVGSSWLSSVPSLLAQEPSYVQYLFTALPDFADANIITAREIAYPGLSTTAQTAYWLNQNKLKQWGLVMTADKGLAAKTLRLDYYFDDNVENIRSVVEQSPTTCVSLISRPYNAGAPWRRLTLAQAILRVYHAVVERQEGLHAK